MTKFELGIITESSFVILGASGGKVRISCSESKGPGATSTLAEEAVDKLQENEKLVAGKNTYQSST